jgi:hypothetical protein
MVSTTTLQPTLVHLLTSVLNPTVGDAMVFGRLDL